MPSHFLGSELRGNNLRRQVQSKNHLLVIALYFWAPNRMARIDLLGPEFLDVVQTGQTLQVHEDGTVEILGNGLSEGCLPGSDVLAEETVRAGGP
jgi:hypothetical protein